MYRCLWVMYSWLFYLSESGILCNPLCFVHLEFDSIGSIVVFFPESRIYCYVCCFAWFDLLWNRVVVVVVLLSNLWRFFKLKFLYIRNKNRKKLGKKNRFWDNFGQSCSTSICTIRTWLYLYPEMAEFFLFIFCNFEFFFISFEFGSGHCQCQGPQDEISGRLANSKEVCSESTFISISKKSQKWLQRRTCFGIHMQSISFLLFC